jgi:hypothetical protein
VLEIWTSEAPYDIRGKYWTFFSFVGS